MDISSDNENIIVERVNRANITFDLGIGDKRSELHLSGVDDLNIHISIKNVDIKIGVD